MNLIHCPNCGYKGANKPLSTAERGESIRQGMRKSKKKIGRPETTDIKLVKKLRAEGLSYRKICQKTGFSIGAVQRAVKSNKIDRINNV